MLITLGLVFLFVLAALGDRAVGGRAVRRWLVEAPARALQATTPGRALIRAVAILALVAMVVSAPEFAAFIGFGDLLILLDVAVLALLIGAWEQVRAAASVARRAVDAILVPQRRGAARRRSPRRPRRRPTPTDDAEGAWAFAAA